MGSFDKEKFEGGFNPKKRELEKTQTKEVSALLDKDKLADTLNFSIFFDRRIEMNKRHYKDIIELAIYSLIGSIPFKIKIDDDDRKTFKEILKEISTSYLEQEKNSLKTAMVSYGYTIDSAIVTESITEYEKQLTAIKISAMELLPVKIKDHNDIKPGSGTEVETEQAWKKYSTLIIIGIIIVVICVAVLFFIL
jgi:hypothetical protein